MSSITLSGNATGTAIFTIASPATSTNRTLTLPDETGELATIADVAAAEGMVVLGTLTTTSGASQSLTGLTLTSYKQLFFDFNGVSHNSGTSQTFSIGAGVIMTNATAGDTVFGNVWVSLWSGVASPVLTRSALPSAVATQSQIAATGYSTSTTTVTVSVSSGAFDAGSIRVYGVK